jgi:hypothetical protein
MSRFTTYLFFLLFAEVAIGGGGRLTVFNGITLRMILFALAILFSMVHFLQGKKIKKEYIILIAGFIVLSVIGLSRGIANGATTAFWWEDLKPLLYFFILPFFCFSITEAGAIKIPANIIKGAGICLSLSFFVTLFLIHSGIIPFSIFYHHVINTGEFFFRGELTFFYKGFLFLCIAFIFFHLTEVRYRFFWMTVMGIAIVLTITRGFWLALFLTYALYYFRKTKIRSLVFALIAIAMATAGQSIISATSQVIYKIQKEQGKAVDDVRKSTLLGDRKYSDDGRLKQIMEVREKITFSSALVGHGFGIGIPTRHVHMEISYLEIFHKQGLLGLAFWCSVLSLLIKKYRGSLPSELSDAFFLSGLFVFIQSLTNQYVNNPIGLSVVLLSIVCLDVSNKK